jgi:outer membrane protein assembly factor BamB
MRNLFAIRLLSFAAGLSLLSLMVGTAAAQPAHSPWPTVHHDRQNTGRSDDFNGPQGPTPKVAWQYKNSAGRTGVTVGPNGNVYAGDGRQPVTKIHKDTGAAIWHSGPGTFYGQADKSTPSLGDNGQVYMGERGNNLLVVDMATGNVLLKKKIRHDGDIRTSPLILDDGSIFHCSGALGAGWCYSMKPEAPSQPEDPYNWFNPLHGSILNVVPALSLDGETIYVALDRRRVVAITADEGTELWRVTPSRRGRGGSVADHSAVVGADGTIYFNGRDGVFALDPIDGSQIWQWEIAARDQVQSRPALSSDGTLYVGVSSKTPYMAAISSAGETVWTYPMDRKGGFVNNSAVIGADGTVYVTFRKQLMAFEADGTDHDEDPTTPDRGVLKWSMVFKRNFKNPMAIGGEGILYVVNGKSVYKVVDDD